MTSLVQITDVTLAEPIPEALVGRHIDHPRRESRIEAHELDIAGWVLSGGPPVRSVEVVHEGSVIRRVPLNWTRHDIADAFGHVQGAAQSGFRTTVPFGGGAAELELDVRAVLTDGRRVPIGTVRGRRAWRDGDALGNDGLVSVVIPCRNQAHFLADAIQSVISQSYSDHEIVVVDDGSTDNTGAVAAQFPGVRYLYQEHLGAPAARNAGMRNTTGAFLVFLDADDRLLPDALRAGIDAFLAHPESGFVWGLWRPIASDGSSIPASETRPVVDDLFTALLRQCFLTIGAVMFRRGVFEGGRTFDPSLDAGDDWDLYLTSVREFPVHCHGTTVFEYRRHGRNMTRDAAKILTSELRVLRRHRRAASAVAGGRQAYRAGRRLAREYHGPRVVEQIRAAVRQRHWRVACRRGFVLLRHHPRALVSLLRRG